MLPDKSNPPKNSSNRDDAYWSSLLDHADAMPQEEVMSTEIETISRDEFVPPTRSASNEKAAWDKSQKAFEAEEIFELVSNGCNKGGLLVEWEGLGGFIPASQLNDFPHVHLESERIKELQRRQHQSITVKIIEVNPTKNRLIFSERAALVGPSARKNLWEDISPGDKRSGTITNMTSFGAFVDLGGVEGLIHISELSWSRLNHPSDVVKPGQHIDAVVLEVDRSNGRIALSLKRMKTDPWAGIEQRYQPGQLVTGMVSNVVQYGAFITLEDELEGLIHISELAEGNFLHPRNVVRKGETVSAKVLNVNGKTRRLALTLRGVNDTEESTPESEE